MIYAVIDTNVLVSIMMSKSSDSTVSKILNAIAFLVTGNLKHFPTTPVVVTPAEMLRILEG